MNIRVRTKPIVPSVRGLLLLAAALVVGPASAQQDHVSNYDVRENPLSPAAVAPPEQVSAVDTLRQRGAKVTLHPKLGVPLHVTSAKGFLSGPDADIEAANQGRGPANVDLHRPIKGFLKEHKAAFGHGDEALAKARKKREFVTAHNGMRTVTWEQEFQDIPVFEGLLTGHITK